MEIPGKRKRKENEDDDRIDTDETEIEKFSEIVENFRAPYNWFRAKISGAATETVRTVTNGDDRKKNEKIVEGDSKRGEDDVWMPCFLLQDFEEEEVIKSWKARALRRSETADPAAEFETIGGGGEEKKDNDKGLDLRLSL